MNHTDEKTTTMRKTSAKRMLPLAVAAFTVAAAIAAALIMTGIIPTGRNNASLPCNDLTSYQSTQQAYDGHRETIGALEAVGNGVAVSVRHADCPADMPDKGYIEIAYRNDAERDGVTGILGNNGLGAFTILVRR